MTPRHCVIAAIVGAAACAAGLWLDPGTMLAVYLAVAVAIASIPIGALGVLLLTYMVPGRWTGDLHPALSRAALLIPLCGLLMLPVLVGLGHLYPWMHEPSPAKLFQAAWLSPAFFVLRTVLYFLILSVLALWAARAWRNETAMTHAAAAGLIVYALVVSFAGVDWLESIEPDFHSSIYGLLFLTMVILAGFAFGLVSVLARNSRRAPVSVYGALLLATLMVWAYNHAMQYVIIWAGNLPDEMIWYTERLRGGWGVALWALYILQFAVPFFALLSEDVRGSRRALIGLAAVTLALRCLETVVLVVPAVPIRPWLLLLDIPAALVLTGALSVLAWSYRAEQVLRLSGAWRR